MHLVDLDLSHLIRSFASSDALWTQKYTLFLKSLFLFNKYKYPFFKNSLQYLSGFRCLLTNYALKFNNLGFLQFVPYFSMILKSRLIYNRSARHERHQCNTNNTSETRATRMQQKCHTNATRTTRVQHECNTNGSSATRVKNFDFDNDASKKIFSHPYTYYMASERL